MLFVKRRGGIPRWIGGDCEKGGCAGGALIGGARGHSGRGRGLSFPGGGEVSTPWLRYSFRGGNTRFRLGARGHGFFPQGSRQRNDRGFWAPRTPLGALDSGSPGLGEEGRSRPRGQGSRGPVEVPGRSPRGQGRLEPFGKGFGNSPEFVPVQGSNGQGAFQKGRAKEAVLGR